MRCSYSSCAVNLTGDRIPGATVYLVPYVTPLNTDISQAVSLYGTETATDAVTSMTTDAAGNVFMWVEEGQYAVVTEKDGEQAVLPHIRLSCSDGNGGGASIAEKKHTIGDGENTSFEIPYNGTVISVSVTDPDGNSINPECHNDGSKLTLVYADDCVPTDHVVTVLCAT